MIRSRCRNPLMLLSYSHAVNGAGWWVPFLALVPALLLVAESDVGVVIDGPDPGPGSACLSDPRLWFRAAKR